MSKKFEDIFLLFFCAKSLQLKSAFEEYFTTSYNTLPFLTFNQTLAQPILDNFFTLFQCSYEWGS